jgi:alcohol dehydrogenase class IV
MIAPFRHEQSANIVEFGIGKVAEAPRLVREVGGTSALLISTPGQAGRAAEALADAGDVLVGKLAIATMHTPVDVTECALVELERSGADCLIAFGGGSAIGLAKALALRTDLPQLAIPTTYSGSEMTPILGETAEGVKRTHRSPRVQPEAVIYDPALSSALPLAVSGPSGLNALAHSIEGLYARDASPLTQMMAETGARAVLGGLRGIIAKSDDASARSELLFGAWLCGVVLASAGMALHHKLCHVLGGSFDLPHAETHAVVLPYALAYNREHAPEALATLCSVFDGADPVASLRTLVRELGTPTSLDALGMPEDGIDRATTIALDQPYWNPRPLEREPLRRLISAAWQGSDP